MQVVGAGLGRTGTTSLKTAVELLLEGPCYHGSDLLQRQQDLPVWADAVQGEQVVWDSLFDGFVGCVDWPGAAVWQEMADAYPDAIVVLSTRDPEKWWQSCQETAFKILQHRERFDPDNPWRVLWDVILEETFTTEIDDRDAAMAAYERHNAEVRATAPPDRFLEWRVEDGWEPLCEALEVPVPDVPFPNLNDRESYVRSFIGGSPDS